jgi:transcriptional regulator with XRE-family HTH domain
MTRKKKEPDIFDDVKRRKRDILSREETCRNKKEKLKKHEQNLKDPIYFETHKEKIRKVERKLTQVARNQTTRFRLIGSLTNQYKCPCCGKVKTNPRNWVISKDKKKVLCRMCFSICGWDYQRKSKIDFSKIKLFTEEDAELRFPLDSLSLCRMRENLKLTVEDFSSLIGWSVSYQYKLESGRVSTISQKIMDEICTAFKRKGFDLKNNIWGEPLIYYKVNGSLIRSYRKLKRISLTELSSLTGWSSAYLSKLESGKVRIISQTSAKLIKNILTK